MVEDNPLLFYCCGLSRFFSGRSNAASGDVYIGNDSSYENSTGCNSKEEIGCDISSRSTINGYPYVTFPTLQTLLLFFILKPVGDMSQEEGTAADWLTGLSLDGGTPNVTDSLMGDQTASISITVTYAQNGTSESRTVRLTHFFS